MTYTITADQLASIKASRLQHLDNGDEAAADALDWAVTAEPIEALFPFGWCIGHVSQDTQFEPGGEVTYDFSQGSDRPEGEGWFAVYTEFQLES